GGQRELCGGLVHQVRGLVEPALVRILRVVATRDHQEELLRRTVGPVDRERDHTRCHRHLRLTTQLAVDPDVRDRTAVAALAAVERQDVVDHAQRRHTIAAVVTLGGFAALAVVTIVVAADAARAAQPGRRRARGTALGCHAVGGYGVVARDTSGTTGRTGPV